MLTVAGSEIGTGVCDNGLWPRVPDVSDKRSISVDDAYDLETPEDSIRLYADWAGTYDTDFVSRLGYVYHRAVAELLIDRAGSDPGAVLDVGCGTGVVD